MSASFARIRLRDVDPPVSGRPDGHPAASTRSRLRKRTLVGSLAVVATGAVVAAPVGASSDTPVTMTVEGGVTPVTLDASLAPERDLPVVVAAVAGFDRSTQVTPVTIDPESAKATAAPATERTVWDRLADCESGDRDRSGNPIPGSARWDYGLTFSHGDIYEGGPNFHPRTWDTFKDADMPGHAGQATRVQQIAVAERVLAAQGWGAWPVCSRMLGLR
jgi:hypothetical protein